MKNYPTPDKELYALVQSAKKWKHYVDRRGDQKPLVIRSVLRYADENQGGLNRRKKKARIYVEEDCLRTAEKDLC